MKKDVKTFEEACADVEKAFAVLVKGVSDDAKTFKRRLVEFFKRS